MWARDPIPRVQDGRAGLHPHDPACSSGEGRSGGPGCYAFPPPCKFDNGILPCVGKGAHCDGNGMGACSSDWVVGLISDEVIIPKDLAPGHWVLSWRWCVPMHTLLFAAHSLVLSVPAFPPRVFTHYDDIVTLVWLYNFAL